MIHRVRDYQVLPFTLIVRMRAVIITNRKCKINRLKRTSRLACRGEVLLELSHNTQTIQSICSMIMSKGVEIVRQRSGMEYEILNCPSRVFIPNSKRGIHLGCPVRRGTLRQMGPKWCWQFHALARKCTSVPQEGLSYILLTKKMWEGREIVNIQ